VTSDVNNQKKTAENDDLKEFFLFLNTLVMTFPSFTLLMDKFSYRYGLCTLQSFSEMLSNEKAQIFHIEIN